MNILLPMAGAGSRFADKGYTQSKPAVPTTNRRTGQKIPMVVAAVEDLPCNLSQVTITFVIRDFHQRDGIPEIIKSHYPKAQFIVIDGLTEGQASTCLLARDSINNDQSLLIAACDNGMDIDHAKFTQLTRTSDALVFTFRHNEAVCARPQAYGWMQTDGDSVTGVSIKNPVSATPMNDHAVVGAFWFKKGRDFVAASEAMIAADDRIHNEFYVDQVFKYMIADGLTVRVLEVSRYICWGTPDDYESYENTLAYWKEFLDSEAAS